ncbi:EF-Hand 1, calcium-binding site [Phytophthora cactorum]|nr:EF-Hand 1, calcium-binding site [Phytophthora cactorum]
MHLGTFEFWAKGQPGVGSVSSRRHYAAPTANAEANHSSSCLEPRQKLKQQMPHVSKELWAATSSTVLSALSQRVCRECSRKFDVEPIARRRFQQETAPKHVVPKSFDCKARTNTTDPADEVDAKISTAFYDILLKTNNVARNSQSTDKASTSQTAYEAQMHRLDRSSSAATASTSFSSTPGRQLADALFSSDALTRARALEIVRQVVKQVTSDPRQRAQLPQLRHLQRLTRRFRCFTRSTPTGKCGQTFCGAATMATTTNLETELDLDDDLDSAALDSICEVAAIRMRCSIAYIVALNARNSHAQRIVGSSGAPRPWTEEVTVCPLPLVANDKPFVIKAPHVTHSYVICVLCATSRALLRRFPHQIARRRRRRLSVHGGRQSPREDLAGGPQGHARAVQARIRPVRGGGAQRLCVCVFLRVLRARRCARRHHRRQQCSSSASQAERNVVQQWDGLGGLRDDGGGLGVAILMHRDAPSSDVECGSSGDSWWTSPKLEQRGHYTLLKELGRGGFECCCSIDILRYLGAHRNIVSLHDVLYLKDETIMLTDLVEGGELFDYIVDMGSVSEQDAAHLLHDVCRALDYVHSRGVCFAAGILIVSLSILLQAYITLTGVHPFDPRGDKSDAEIVKEIANGKYDVENKWYKSLTAEAKDFLTRLLDSDPAKRLTAKQALQHSWLSGITTSAEPLDSGYTQRLQSYQRLQQLRANILAVVMGVQHAKLGKTSGANEKRLTSHRTATVNMDMFKETFSLFDKDESGCIDRDELKSMLLALGQQLSSSEIDEIMRQADTDGDGKISFTEFVSMMNERLFRRAQSTKHKRRCAARMNCSDVDNKYPAQLKLT